MKVIFDFDDTLFDTKKFTNEVLFGIFERIHPEISFDLVRVDYVEFRKLYYAFSLDAFIEHLIEKYKIKNLDAAKVKGQIALRTKDYVMEGSKTLLGKIGKENSLILSQGDEVFQKFKITTAGISDLVSEIKIVEESKEESLREFCNRFKGEKVYFVDNRLDNFIIENIPENLSQILVSKIDMVNELNGKGLESVVRVISEVKDF